jgi:hypothetical protein
VDGVGLNLNPYRYEDRAERHRYDRSSHQRFDRLAFALRAVELLRPASTTVIVFRSQRLHVQQGRDLRRGNGARWAMVGIPSDASAESIALALADIEGVTTGPFVFDLALAAAQVPEGAS